MMFNKFVNQRLLKTIGTTILANCSTTNSKTNIISNCGLRHRGSDSAAYGGDGKTTVRVLNNEDTHLHLVNTYSSKGFRLSNNLFVSGSILLFPTNIFCWNVRSGADISLDSLILFDLIVPKVKIVIIGYGQQGEPHDASIPMKLKKKGISCEMLPTPNAVTTYNYLVGDAVHVAGAFVTMKDDVHMDDRDQAAVRGYDVFKDIPLFPEVPEGFESIDDAYEHKLAQDKLDNKKKKTFDE